MTFRRTDYEPIARRYDEFRERWSIPPDDALDAAVESVSGPRVLDLGCGTGSYIESQAARVARPIKWVGLDASAAMLAGAREKDIPADLIRARAEELPFRNAAFDYVFSSFAFHHFVDKDAALDEVERVLKPGANFRIVNFEPWSVPSHWVYRFFDGTRDLDTDRFWPVERMRNALEVRGFTTDVAVEIFDEQRHAAEVLAESESRTISQLAVVDDRSYEEGLRRLGEIVADDPDAPIESVSSTLRITARLL